MKPGGHAMRKITREQFAAHANQQIANARAMRRSHRAQPGGYCTCGRQTPCSVDQACRATVTHYENKLALLDVTTLMPVLIAPARDEGRPSSGRWRLLLGGLL
jgi:hypothetical protein